MCPIIILVEMHSWLQELNNCSIRLSVITLAVVLYIARGTLHTRGPQTKWEGVVATSCTLQAPRAISVVNQIELISVFCKGRLAPRFLAADSDKLYSFIVSLTSIKDCTECSTTRTCKLFLLFYTSWIMQLLPYLIVGRWTEKVQYQAR